MNKKKCPPYLSVSDQQFVNILLQIKAELTNLDTEDKSCIEYGASANSKRLIMIRGNY